jgi:hypothetical protein
MNTNLKQMLPAIETWPAEDQEALGEAAREIEANRTGVYHATSFELSAIDRGREYFRAGRFVPDNVVAGVRAKFRSA